jgi:hypothetical protein
MAWPSHQWLLLVREPLPHQLIAVRLLRLSAVCSRLNLVTV